MKKYAIPVIAGDGIGPEVIKEGKKVLEEAAKLCNFGIEWKDYPYGAEHYLKTGELLPDKALKEMAKHKVIYLGAVGDPRVGTGILVKGIILKLRFYFDQYVNLRPVKLLPGVMSPLKGKESSDIDITIIRENTEDFYIGCGGRSKKGKTKKEIEIIRKLYKVKFNLDVETDSEEIAYQLGIMSKEGAQRVIKYGFNFATKNNLHNIVFVDKANALSSIYGFWRENVEEISKSYPDIKYDFAFADAASMWLIKSPERLKVMVMPNMFGDILSDEGAMIAGGLGLAPGANINPNGTSMFEPIHGSAPKYAGKGVADPIATIWAGGLMLRELGEIKAYDLIIKAISEVLSKGKVRTYDLGGNNSTAEMGDAIARELEMVGD